MAPVHDRKPSLKHPGAFLHLIALTLPALPSATPAQDLGQLSIEELLEVEVVSTSRHSQTLMDAAAAVFVIDHEDIRRSGATVIPEVLRLAPGLQVARLDTDHWAVSARGFNGRFANKLLVLVDGRSIYTPTFSGVYWEAHDLPLENIERIEIIRGPGAALWGANAVNGIINIITRPATTVEGGMGVFVAGDLPQKVFIRQSGEPFEGARLYGYGQFRHHDGLTDAAGERSPAHSARAGLRLDWSLDPANALMLQGDLQRSEVEHHILRPLSTAPFSQATSAEAKTAGGHLLTRWEHRTSLASRSALQFNYQWERHRELLLEESRHTLELDFQHWRALDERQQLVWGAGYRYSRDGFEDTAVASLEPADRTDRLLSFFIHDEIRLGNRLDLTLGSKLEHNDYTGWEFQPNARLLWSPAPRHRLWGAVSRALRTPARVEHGLDLWLSTMAPDTPRNPGPLPVRIELRGDEDFDSEQLLAWELGYRTRPRNDLSLDVAVFYHRYRDLYASKPVEPEPVVIDGETQILSSFLYDNRMDGHSHGLELAAHWQPGHRVHWQLTYSYLDLDLTPEPGTLDPGQELHAGNAPRHQFSLKGQWNPVAGTELDLWLRYSDQLPTLLTPEGVFSIDEHWGLDLRVAWHPAADLELSLVGQNLLDPEHLEFLQEFHPAPTEVERSFYGRVKWEF